jgi:hypothetical protein
LSLQVASLSDALANTQSQLARALVEDETARKHAASKLAQV